MQKQSEKPFPLVAINIVTGESVWELLLKVPLPYNILIRKIQYMTMINLLKNKRSQTWIADR